MKEKLRDKIYNTGLIRTLINNCDMIINDIQYNDNMRLTNVVYNKDIVHRLEILNCDSCMKSLLVILSIIKEEKTIINNVFNSVILLFTTDKDNVVATEFRLVVEIYEDIYRGSVAINEFRTELTKPYYENKYLRNTKDITLIEEFLMSELINPLIVLYNDNYDPLTLTDDDNIDINKNKYEFCNLLSFMRKNQNLFRKDSIEFERLYKLIRILDIYVAFYYVLGDIIKEDTSNV